MDRHEQNLQNQRAQHERTVCASRQIVIRFEDVAEMPSIPSCSSDRISCSLVMSAHVGAISFRLAMTSPFPFARIIPFLPILKCPHSDFGWNMYILLSATITPSYGIISRTSYEDNYQ